jgi:hypothetical protein
MGDDGAEDQVGLLAGAGGADLGAEAVVAGVGGFGDDFDTGGGGSREEESGGEKGGAEKWVESVAGWQGVLLRRRRGGDDFRGPGRVDGR